jgi:hypothetical protein
MPPTQLEWTPPPPRPGFLGSWDRFIGPGATRAENILILGAAVAAGLALPLYAALRGLGWTALQLVVGGLVAADLAGGVVANAAGPAKAWYHRPGQGFRQHLGFVAVHIVDIALVAGLFRGLDWAYAAGVYGYLLLATIVVLWVPLYLQRPVALLLYGGAILLNAYLLPPTAGMEWFVPVLFLKLLVAHVPRETPFRPAGAQGD